MDASAAAASCSCDHTHLGLATENLNWRWYEANAGQVIAPFSGGSGTPMMGTTLNGRVGVTGAVFGAKFMLPLVISEAAGGATGGHRRFMGRAAPAPPERVEEDEAGEKAADMRCQATCCPCSVISMVPNGAVWVPMVATTITCIKCTPLPNWRFFSRFFVVENENSV
jgi:hypothetical protein